MENTSLLLVLSKRFPLPLIIHRIDLQATKTIFKYYAAKQKRPGVKHTAFAGPSRPHCTGLLQDIIIRCVKITFPFYRLSFSCNKR